MINNTESLDDSSALLEQVSQAIQNKTSLRIRGGDTKAFLGRTVASQEIDTRKHRGVVSYDPTELVITVRVGTPVAELSAVLDASEQMLPCEPPEFAGNATVGGMVASGLAGPRRPWSGSVRDLVLGCRVITGHAKHLRFGGQVMKNVAGYDVSRLFVGSYGCLGLLTEVSLKVLPKPRQSSSVSLVMDSGSVLRELSAWRMAALPVSAACYFDGKLHVRLEGGEGSVKSALDRIGGDELSPEFWTELREWKLPFFQDARPLWRLSLPNNTPLAELPGDALFDWGGAQRWLKTDASATEIRELALAAGGHATCFSATPGVDPFQPLDKPLMRFHQQLKEKMDPHGVFNPQRMYAHL